MDPLIWSSWKLYNICRQCEEGGDATRLDLGEMEPEDAKLLIDIVDMWHQGHLEATKELITTEPFEELEEMLRSTFEMKRTEEQIDEILERLRHAYNKGVLT
jgi:hypothetical protein